MCYDVSFLLGGFSKWTKKRKNVVCIWEYQLKTRHEKALVFQSKKRLEAFCKFKGYEIIDYYEDAGISAKTGNHRPEFERLKNDIKSKKINTIVALKLDRITRSIYDWENLMTFLDENNAYLDCVNDEINTTSAKIDSLCYLWYTCFVNFLISCFTGWHGHLI